ncbi:HNH endonuclease signature motif containing protein [Microbispora rosea]|uniref:HNH endonuclease signature motif containing protein n=1 Tax=Microbispora rosea TaxID=58117 RepID=UPI0012DD59E1|nr:HNH endonuclease signature motif containing protein [Microbispora rosea]
MVREIRVELTTLLGLDEHPAQLPGWGVIHPCLARRIVEGMLAGQWRYAICHDSGHLALTGLTRARPHTPGRSRPARDRRRGGLVELQITLSHLRMLAAQPAGVLGAWAPVVAELSAHAAPLLTTGEAATASGDTVTVDTVSAGTVSGGAAPDSTAFDGTALGGPVQSAAIQDRDEAGARHEDRYGNGMADGRAEGLADGAVDSERRRLAGAALRRYVQIRGRVCSWPGCRTPATRTDQDHILPWAEQGPTKAENLHLACRHDHRARHHGGWRVSTAGPHVVVWTSPLGHRYPSPLPKIIITTCSPHPRSQTNTPAYRYLGDLSDTPTMSPASEPPLPQEAPQAQTGVATPPKPEGEAGTHGSLLGDERDEPPF